MTQTEKRIAVFVGPSIRGDTLHALVRDIPADVQLLRPVKQGDIIRLYNQLPDVIAIIDGYFFQQPSVYHKEIMHAMELGAHVLGSSSLGALRAAELDRFGMEGVGEIYQLFRSGVIDGDDMVALAHDDASANYKPLSIPLVNLRHDLLRAATAGVVPEVTARAVLQIAQNLFFRDRTLSNILRSARAGGVDAGELVALEKFLRTQSVDLKEEDARALLRILANRARTGQWPEPARTPVNHTTYFVKIHWDHVGYEVRGRYIRTRLALNLQRLLNHGWLPAIQRIGQRCLALDECKARGIEADPPEQLLQAFRPYRKRASDDAWRAWLAARHLHESELVQVLGERQCEARLLRQVRRRQGRRNGSLRTNGKAIWAEILASVAHRTGIRPSELDRRALQHPGVAWDGPLMREMKVRGQFGLALDLAHRVLDLHDSFEERNPNVLARMSKQGLLKWFAQRWGVAEDAMRPALRLRGFMDENEFVEVARVGYVFDKLWSKKAG